MSATITLAEMEHKLDRLLQARLAVDAAYRHAESVEAQDERETEIGQEIWADLVVQYGEPS